MFSPTTHSPLDDRSTTRSSLIHRGGVERHHPYPYLEAYESWRTTPTTTGPDPTPSLCRSVTTGSQPPDDKRHDSRLGESLVGEIRKEPREPPCRRHRREFKGPQGSKSEASDHTTTFLLTLDVRSTHLRSFGVGDPGRVHRVSTSVTISRWAVRPRPVRRPQEGCDQPSSLRTSMSTPPEDG